MIRILIFLFALLLFGPLSAQNSPKPKLVVGIVIDQMRQDYLDRFDAHFGEEGFKRIREGGYDLKNAHFNYVPTETGPGHASVYTGSTPSLHGIIANQWYVRGANASINCVEDSSVTGVGSGKGTGNRSPKNLIVNTLTDQLKNFSKGKAKVVSISIKDRGAILPGGHEPDGAYWYDHSNGEFMTSSYYMDQLPGWLREFNQRKLADQYMSMSWDTYKPIETYVESEQDNRPYEKALHASLDPVFPYDLEAVSKKRNKYGLVPDTPFGNTLITELALAALKKEQLGQTDQTDFLAISYSATDYIGHDYGPMSKEIQDTYIRMDQELARIFRELDKNVGVGQWSMFLTADHGVVEIPQSLMSKNISAGYLNRKEISTRIIDFVKSRNGGKNLVEKVYGNQIFLDQAGLSNLNDNGSQLTADLIEYLENQEGIAKAIRLNDHVNYAGEDLHLKLVKAGLNQERSGDILYFLESGWLEEYYEDGGTGHGSYYEYDTHVPMIFYGSGIVKGSDSDYHPIIDITPTIAQLLGLKLPESCMGQPVSTALLSGK